MTNRKNTLNTEGNEQKTGCYQNKNRLFSKIKQAVFRIKTGCFQNKNKNENQIFKNENGVFIFENRKFGISKCLYIEIFYAFFLKNHV